MRVIAGRAGGIRLARVPAGTRPVSDRAREGLFSSLGAVDGARCLDLFAGTGAVGIEALSRGAESCTFVDSGAAAIRTIRENLSRAGLADRATVTRGDALRFLGRAGDRFDLIFLDPPYSMARGRLRTLLEALSPRLAPGGGFVLTRPKQSDTDVIPVNYRAERRLAYGDTLVLVCREER